MKTTKFLLLAFIFSLAISCAEKPEEKADVILQADKSSISNDGISKVTFKVVSGDEDITSKSAIYLDNEGNLQIVEDNSFSSDKAGEYEFFAISEGIESNRITITVTNDFTSVTLKASTFNIPNDGVTPVEFTVFDNDKDVTSEATIYKVSGEDREALQGNSFSTTQEGTYQFIAEYNGMESEAVFVTAESQDSFALPKDGNPESTDFHNRVMVMKNTGTGCAYCPLVSAAIKEVLKDETYADKMSVVELHNFNDTDPMMNQTALRIRDIFNIQGWPLVIYNMRGDVTSASEGGNDLSPEENMNINISTVKKIVDEQLATPSDAGISAVSKIEGNVISIKAAVKAGKTAEYHLGVFILEDNIKASQNEYEPDTEAYPEDFDPNKHINVLRATYDGCDIDTGDLSGIDLGTVEAGKTAETEMSITIDKKWIIDNCHLVFYVCSKDGDKFVVRNSEKSSIGQKIAFRYN